ncbi:MAG: family 43 glycosylhydrolase [Opitutaceae bacterium]|nr:family 43 glycosylhydrolase [Opitutaceae bacterium]MBP9913369.1 family 43 glycosylhydrolase [Opitutaceae bacterium]
MPKLGEIQLRDPFILADAASGIYRLYGTTAMGGPMEAPDGFSVRTSHDLHMWSEPKSVLPRPAGPADADYYWAPEVHFYQGRWFLFGSFSAGLNILKPRARYTAIYVAPTPDGPFVLHSDGPATPLGWRSIDGTLHLDREARPWLVFIREWTQTIDGEIHAMPLSADLRRPSGPPQLLFRASEAAWSLAQKSELGDGYRVTDGPWLHRTAAGVLLLLWSSFGQGGYLTGIARSTTGAITGPWVQSAAPLYAHDGGHPMLFRTFSGQLLMALHTPNRLMLERVRLLPVRETADGLALA